VDICTSAVKNNLEFITDMCTHLGLEVYVSLVYLGAKLNHIYQASRITTRTVHKTIIINTVVVDCVYIYIYIYIYTQFTLYIYIYIYKVNQSRYRPGVAQRVPGS